MLTMLGILGVLGVCLMMMLRSTAQERVIKDLFQRCFGNSWNVCRLEMAFLSFWRRWPSASCHMVS